MPETDAEVVTTSIHQIMGWNECGSVIPREERMDGIFDEDQAMSFELSARFDAGEKSRSGSG
jgi:hypothetical protein